MPARSLSISQQFIEQVKDAVAKRGLTQGQLASELGIARSSIVKFLSGQNVDRRIFVRCCAELEMSWEEVSGRSDAQPENPTNKQITTSHIEKLVKKVRNEVKADIHVRCSTMRVLDMEQPIGLGDIYTSVNILEKLLGRRRLSVNELIAEHNIENFDRFALGQIHQRLVPGLKAVEQYNKLMILGKPGAGKTTFMKRLATLCNQGEFQANQVPVFVTLKEFAEVKGHPALDTYISQQWQQCGVKDVHSTENVLKQGRALILLDGLDEVQEIDHQRVLNEIKHFSHKFRDCQFVMTCRIAAREYTFQQFTEVEVADFNDKQIIEFTNKWFSAKKDPKKIDNFIQRLNTNKPIKELATNPLLLTLLCLVFEDAADFPANRAELYKEGLDVLLKKWDAKRNIQRHQVYKKLSLKRKEDLLSQLAFYTFDRGDYFFKQSVIERQIIDYIRNLPDAKDDYEALELDGADVLASIEAQHGLLIERARGIYSFSHLTFQEYFTAKQITRSTVNLYESLKKLTTHIHEQQYREVFLLTAGMLPEADDLLRMMKKEIDYLLIDDPQLQKFLSWVNKKANSMDVSYKKAAVRAFYFNFVLEYRIKIKQIRIFNLADYDLALAIDHTLDRIHSIEQLDSSLRLDFSLSRKLAFAYTLALTLDLDITLALSNKEDLVNDLDLKFEHNLGFANSLTSGLDAKLNDLNAYLPNIKNHDHWKKWWREQGKDWVDKLRSVMVEYRDIGHNWALTDIQQEKLQKYYNANKLLVDCLNSDCYITKATRQETEETLLLPMSELEKQQNT